jgi:hypothetical protein
LRGKPQAVGERSLTFSRPATKLRLQPGMFAATQAVLVIFRRRSSLWIIGFGQITPNFFN